MSAAEDPGGAVADLFAADYVGALVGGTAFPFLLLPWLGQLTGALLTGGVNALAGGALVLGLFRRDLTRRARWTLAVANLLVLGLLASAALLVDDFERAARHAVYGAEVRVAPGPGSRRSSSPAARTAARSISTSTAASGSAAATSAATTRHSSTPR